MVVSIYCGITKPASIEHFLKPFVEDLNLLMKNGVEVDGRRVNFKIRAIIADSPARAFIKGVANFNSFAGCLKCTTEGIKLQGRVTFLDCNASERTDEAFRKQMYGDHHKIDSPLLLLDNFDIILQIIVSDQLHLIDLGVTKRFLIGLIEGKFGFKKRLSPSTLAQLSGMLMNIQLSAEIHRKFRSFKDLRHWKGSEFSSFLFYASVVCFKSVMSSEQHKHFMLYFCAITLFSSDVYKEHWPLANNLLQLFVKKYADIYGPQFVSSNIHNLLHVYKEVKHFGPLYTLSSYKFENLLQQMKLLLRNGYKCLEQVINRLLEQDEYYVHKKKDSFNYPFIHQRGNIITLHIREAFCLKYGQRNGWFLTKSGYVCQYINAVSHIKNNQTNFKITAKD
ncbi:uncharacterized protein LOC120896607 isoform X2 [Anopheles arabiensis]|nr:uncharacterized protein LOC120896607 isoform X2 [Anopheles arabiensis]